MKKLTLIDLDSIAFIVAGNTTYKDLKRNERTELLFHNDVSEFIKTILEATAADFYAGYYQKPGHTNYRKLVYPKYKSNRPPAPEFILEWRPAIVDVFEKLKMTGLSIIESDDALSVAYNHYHNDYDITVAHIDEDLNCIPGKHYNYKRNESYEISVEEAEINYKVQCISGAAKDGVPGIYGIGKVKATKFLMNNELRLVKSFKEAFIAQKKFHLEDSWIKLFYVTYHCKKLLSNIDELSRYTDQKECDIFNLEDCSVKTVKVAGIENW